MSTSERPSVFSRPGKLILVLGFILVLIWTGFRLIFPTQPTLFAGTPPTQIGIQGGHLAGCPPTPNCVSTESSDRDHSIQPIAYRGSVSDVMAGLAEVIAATPRAKIIEQTDHYLYATFSSFLMGFVDDVEFYGDETQQVIQVRSASRLGESDLGVNGQRVAGIRDQLERLNLTVPQDTES